MNTLLFIVLYFLIGEIVSLVNWIYFVNNENKNKSNVLIYFAVSIFIWPLMLIGIITEKIFNFIINGKHKD